MLRYDRSVAQALSWRFGKLDRVAKIITEDTTIYRVPDELHTILESLAGVLQERRD